MYRTSFLILMLGLCLSGFIRAQEVEFSVQINSAKDEQTANGIIALSIDKGNPSYTVYLFDKAPWKGGTELRKLENVTTRMIELENLLPGDYYIIVEDKDRNPQAKAVRIGIMP